MTDDELRNGKPKAARNERQGFDKFHWPPSEHFPDGLRIQVYDDGRVKVGGWETSVAVMDVMNRGPGRYYRAAMDHLDALTAVWLYHDDKQIKRITYREEQGEPLYSVTVRVL